MRNKSHALMGQILLREYLPDISHRQAKFFLLGCTEPDKNPATYLKGSLRAQWMRGHNYGNSSRYMARLAMRLEKKSVYSAWDYYCLGKLIHYTMDAFTFAHDARFATNLSVHRAYERQLQNYFLTHIPYCPVPSESFNGSPLALIRQMHVAYARSPGCIKTDTEYAFRACCTLMCTLTALARQDSFL